MYTDQIKTRMRELGITQEQLAFSLGLSPKTVNVKLNGHYELTMRELVGICELLKIRIAQLDFD